MSHNKSQGRAQGHWRDVPQLCRSQGTGGLENVPQECLVVGRGTLGVSHKRARGGRRCIKKCYKIWSRGGQGHWSVVLQIVAKVDTWALKECLPVGAKDVHTAQWHWRGVTQQGRWGGGGGQRGIGRSTNIKGPGLTHVSRGLQRDVADQ